MILSQNRIDPYSFKSLVIFSRYITLNAIFISLKLCSYINFEYEVCLCEHILRSKFVSILEISIFYFKNLRKIPSGVCSLFKRYKFQITGGISNMEIIEHLNIITIPHFLKVIFLYLFYIHVHLHSGICHLLNKLNIKKCYYIMLKLFNMKIKVALQDMFSLFLLSYFWY